MKTKLLAGGIQVYNGTPSTPLTAPALFLRIVKLRYKDRSERTKASLTLVRPGAAGYAVKELISDMELAPEAAVEKAVDIAVRGDVKVIYLNAKLEKIPLPIRHVG